MKPITPTDIISDVEKFYYQGIARREAQTTLGSWYKYECLSETAKTLGKPKGSTSEMTSAIVDSVYDRLAEKTKVAMALGRRRKA